MSEILKQYSVTGLFIRNIISSAHHLLTCRKPSKCYECEFVSLMVCPAGDAWWLSKVDFRTTYLSPVARRDGVGLM